MPLLVELTPRGRQRAAPQDPIKAYGRHFVRTVDMFVLPAVVIKAGMEYDSEHSTSAYTPELLTFAREQRNYRAWEALLHMIPTLSAILIDPNADQPITRVSAALLAGSNAARSDDTRTIKIAIVEWLSGDLQQASVVLHPSNKAQRGFNNPVTGRLLCPIGLDYGDEIVRKLLETHQATVDGEPVNGSHWPIFAFDEQTYNPAMPWESFLRGRLIVQAFRHIFTSPTSAFTDDHAASVQNSRSTRTGNAALHGMTRVTPGSIVYCATQVHFALSTAPVFNKNSKNNDSIIFYRSLVKYFEDPHFAAPVQDLLDWWNRAVFPAHHRPQRSTVNHGLRSMHATMDAFRASAEQHA
ncbi:hypothetical protein BD414DRAFT_525063 [Trametes punicea]|nr:hypothetical protein BD414DRAFT_525063 [Trametes punicea]